MSWIMNTHLFARDAAPARPAEKALPEAMGEIMRQAFCRRDRDTVRLLAGKGVPFTEEMLHIAVGFPDIDLARLCLENGVAPTREMIRRADVLHAEHLSALLRAHAPRG